MSWILELILTFLLVVVVTQKIYRSRYTSLFVPLVLIAFQKYSYHNTMIILQYYNIWYIVYTNEGIDKLNNLAWF